MAQNLTETLAALQRVTKTNLEILKALNDSFYSKREHVTAVVDGTKYNIPSYLYLESKIGDLENNFENLVNAPKTGTAAFVFDGNTQEIEMRTFSVTPEGIALKPVQNFDVESNKIFKDFLSPNPYIRLDLSSIGSDVTEVVVKKIDIRNENLLSQITGISTEDNTVKYSDVVKILAGYKADDEYIEYDTIRRLPIRSDAPVGTYTIKKINNNYTDENLIQHYTLTFNEKLNYWVESGTLQRQVMAGDELITSNGMTKLYIDRVDYQKNLVDVTVENGAFADLTEYDKGYQNNDLAILKYFSLIGEDTSKYIDVPLEEDKHILVFVAILDSRLNIQGPWDTGLVIDTDNLTIEEEDADGNITVYTFTDYYNMKINNIGDTLFGLTRMFSTDMFNWDTSEFDIVTKQQPEINQELLQVIEINSHLNDSESVKKIRSLHKQKTGYKSDLTTVQADIDKLTKIVNQRSFATAQVDSTVYQNQLSNLNTKKSALNRNISQIVNEIADNVNNADVPIEDAKYHIRGFYDVEHIEEVTGHKVIRIDVEYRYKNRNRKAGNATSFSLDDDPDSKTYIYSDWNKMPSFTLYKHPTLTSQTIGVEYDPSTDEINVPSFNQIDIPITQGETVDIRLRVQYADGFPFIEVMSDWSPIVNVAFPDEFVTNIPLTKIISINNDDAERYRFLSILDSEGVLTHVADKVQDQNITYFHQPEDIASGFFTEERRIIPLKDKLMDMSSKLDVVMDEIYAIDQSPLKVTISDSIHRIELIPNGETKFIVPAYNDTASSRTTTGNAVDIINLTLTNETGHNVKLYSMFPGTSSAVVDENTRSKFNVSDYYDSENQLAVYGYSNSNYLIASQNDTRAEATTNLFAQHQNQVLYFRLNNPYNAQMYYADADDYVNDSDEPQDPEAIDSTIMNVDNILCGSNDVKYIRKTDATFGATLTMNISSLRSIMTPRNSRFYNLQPGDSISIPLEFRYKLDENEHIEKTVSFDVWTSLFSDPTNYTFTVRANWINDVAEHNIYDIPAEKYTPNVLSSIISNGILKSEQNVINR